MKYNAMAIFLVLAAAGAVFEKRIREKKILYTVEIIILSVNLVYYIFRLIK